MAPAPHPTLILQLPNVQKKAYIHITNDTTDLNFSMAASSSASSFWAVLSSIAEPLAAVPKALEQLELGANRQI